MEVSDGTQDCLVVPPALLAALLETEQRGPVIRGIGSVEALGAACMIDARLQVLPTV
ncbi:MAG: hypothetical protein ACRDJ4_10085 [Actinomycetota bacterium]